MKNIIIPVYNNTEHISDCLNSCFQTADTVVWLGIDGCKETLKYVLSIKSKYRNLRVFYFPENKGTYITLNTLIAKIPPNKKFMIFGSDDYMLQGMVSNMFKGATHGQAVYSRYTGIVCMYKSDYDKLGSFRAWRISADTEFSTRAKRIIKYKNIGMMFHNRQHEEQITKSYAWGFGSEARRIYGKFIVDETPLLPVYVTPVLHERELEVTRITANMATFPPRADVLRKSLRSLQKIPYFDKIRIYLNEYNERPRFISARVEVQRGDNLKDSGKLYWASEERNEIYFTVDDDLHYTDTYVMNHILKLAEHPEAVVTIHGRKLKPYAEKFTEAEIMQHWKNSSDVDVVIHLPGTGVSCFSLIHNQFNLPKYHGMTDVHVGVECRKRGTVVLCRARSGDELKYLLSVDEKQTLWNERSRMERQCRELLQSVDWNDKELHCCNCINCKN